MKKKDPGNEKDDLIYMRNKDNASNSFSVISDYRHMTVDSADVPTPTKFVAFEPLHESGSTQKERT
jgi:hypothetical protein